MTDANAASEVAPVHQERALPEAIYPLQDGSYGDRSASDAERSALADGDTPPLPWGKGALLLNPSTKSYLTPYGFKALFEHSPKLITDRFEHAGLDPEKSYFHDGAPDILIHGPDGRFVAPSDMPEAKEGVPLAQQFREEDIYLQNFNHDGSKHTGSYTPFVRANDWLKEFYTEALAGEAWEGEKEGDRPEDDVAAPKQKAAASQRTLNHRPRGRGMTRRTTRKAGQQPARP